MTLNPHQALSLAIIIYYTPSLIPTTLLLRRHNLGRAWGWLYLFIFADLRITGASLHFASEYDGDGGKKGLRRAAAMFASVGVMTLLLGMLEVLVSVKTTIKDPIPPRLWTLLHISQYAAFILSVIYTITGGDRLSYAAAILVACLFIGQAVICVVFYFRLRSHPHHPHPHPQPHQDEDEDDKHNPNHDQNPLTQSQNARLILLTLWSIPFLAVRVTYMLLSTFVNGGVSIFSGEDLDGDGDVDTAGNVEKMKRANRGKLHEGLYIDDLGDWISFPMGKERLVGLDPRNERMSEGVLSNDRRLWYQ
ncbi:hypothetical protein BDW59DRAFT_161017 [Aspergillus cavernicola]|uniref:DUF7702 domain-containing protein n=1 Tax=Aspergillus cavernicola TaxID=176166 RepID=A0ABR4IGY1_9EURO